MTFKTEKGQLAYQWLLGLKICVWVGYFGYILVFHAIYSEHGMDDGFLSYLAESSFICLCFVSLFLAALSLLNVVRRIMLITLTKEPYAKSFALRNAILAGLYGVAFLLSVSAYTLFATQGWSLYVQWAHLPALCIPAGIALWSVLSKEEQPVFTVKLYRRKLLVLSLVVIFLLPAFFLL